MIRDDIIRMAQEAGFGPAVEWSEFQPPFLRFAAMVAAAEREACVGIIESYRIPVGNSRSGELACEWTYDALKEIRDEIRARGQA